MIAEAVSRALAQAGDPVFRRVLLRALGLTLLLLGPFVFGFAAFLQWLLPESVNIPFYGPVAFLDDLASGVGVAVLLFLSVFLMIPVAGLFLGLFLEPVADAVERRHYPDLPPVPGPGLLAGLVEGLRFALLFLGVNLLALVVYLAATALAPLVFWAVNGLLLGREYFQLVAMRRLSRRQADALRRRHFGTIWLAGALMAVPLSVPLLSLLVPILGVASFTHLFHRLNGAPAAG